MRRLFASITILSLCLLVGACDSGTAPTQATVAGTWNLTSLNGSPPPVTVQAANPRIDVTLAQMQLGTDGGFSLLTVEKHTTGTTAENFTYTDAGYYVLIDNEITLGFTDGSSLIGQIDGNTITLNLNGVTEIYEKKTP